MYNTVLSRERGDCRNGKEGGGRVYKPASDSAPEWVVFHGVRGQELSHRLLSDITSHCIASHRIASCSTIFLFFYSTTLHYISTHDMHIYQISWLQHWTLPWRYLYSASTVLQQWGTAAAAAAAVLHILVRVSFKGFSDRDSRSRIAYCRCVVCCLHGVQQRWFKPRYVGLTTGCDRMYKRECKWQIYWSSII